MSTKNIMSKKTLIVGAGNTELQTSKTVTEIDNSCILYSVVVRQFTEPKEEIVFKFKARPIIEELWIDPKESVFNQDKHNQTCIKNRKKRKKRKRR